MSTAIEREYSFGAAARILDIPEAKLRYWSQSGFVGPSLRRGPRQAYTFQDLVSVRAAKELVERGFQPAYVRKALAQIRATLPTVDRPLTKLRVSWDGNTLALVEDGLTFEVSGQRRFDFGLSDLAARAAEVLALAGARPEAEAPAAASPRTAYECFAAGLAKEAVAGQEAAAEECYRQALAADPGLAAAHTNLGELAFRRGDVGRARREFEAALALDPEQPEARYDLATILYQQGDIEQAASELRRVVAQSPWFADAHYNLATALERLGGKRQAVVHLDRFVDLQAASPQVSSSWLDEARARLRRLDA
ncbi:MAG: tetratricopeptide repeat protein [Deltaproteobacteria bacterium]|nr:tetratricopeptide repeat protein [Deltaproteobacteria bacterium]